MVMVQHTRRLSLGTLAAGTLAAMFWLGVGSSFAQQATAPRPGAPQPIAPRPITGSARITSEPARPAGTRPQALAAPGQTLAAPGQAPAPGGVADPRPVTRPVQQVPAPTGTPAGTGRPAGQSGPPAGPVTPAGPPQGFPLPAAEQQRVDQVLAYWEAKTSEIVTFQTRFTRQNFDFVFGEKDKPRTVDKGIVRYSAPDKGEMKVEEVWKYNPQPADPKQPYDREEVQFGEWWLCDGISIYQFDSRNRTLTETRLPPEMQGQAIGDGPLPFLFGAKAATMKERYWIREVTPKDSASGEYWLEAYPKRQSDAANFDKLLVKLTLHKEQLLPSAMKVFNKQGHMTYHFEDQTPNDPRHRLAGFLKYFVRPSVPRGWTKVIENWNGQRLNEDGSPAEDPALQAEAKPEAVKPATAPRKR
jgi:TIGR03009 family protein